MFNRCPLIYGLLAFSTGILCADALPSSMGLSAFPVPWILALLPLGLVISAVALRYSGRQGICIVAASLVLAGAGGLLQGARANGFFRQELVPGTGPTTDGPAWYTGRVCRRPSVKNSDTILHVDLEYCEPGNGASRIPCSSRIRLKLPVSSTVEGTDAPLLVKGQQIRFFTTLRNPEVFLNPGRFDYLRYLAARRIRFTAALKSPLLIQQFSLPEENASVIFSHWMERTIRSRYNRPQGSGIQPPGALLAACLTGERRWVSQEDTELLRRSGLGHLLAISGLHLGLLGVMVTILLSGLRVPIRLRRLALIVFFLAYHEMCGATPSITRATVTAVVYLSGGLLGVHSRPGNSLAAAGLSLLFLNPLMLHDAGFLLSFFATFSILVLGPVFVGRRSGLTPARIPSRLFAVSAAVLLGIAPLQAVLFHHATPATLLINPIAGPLLGLSMTSGLLFLVTRGIAELLPAIFFLPLETVCSSAAQIMDFGFGSILFLARQAAPLSFRLPAPSPLVCAVYYLLLGCAVLASRSTHPTGRTKMILLLSCSAPCLLLTSAAVGGGGLPGGVVRLTFLDVGQGDATIIECPGRRTLVIDGGAARPQGGFDFGEMVVSPAIWHRGLHSIDAVAVSHGHQDHAGGLASVTSNFHPRQILSGRLLATDLPSVRNLLSAGDRCGADLVRLHRGMVTRWGDVQLIVLHPPPHGSTTLNMGPNNNSLVLLLRHNAVRVLFTGDLQEEGEELLLRSPLCRLMSRCHLLKVGHHGAPGATSARWLTLVSPDTAVITAGRHNRFGHPDPSLHQRLRNSGCRYIHCTGHDGALTVVSDGHRLLYRNGPS